MTIRSAGALRLTAAAGLVLLLSSCHPLINPVDPNSTAFTGVETTRESPDEPEPLLPYVIAWESVSEHAPNQFLGLEITNDGSFVEPRQPQSPLEHYIVLTFEDRIDWEMLSQATCFLRVSFASTYVTLAVPLEIYEGTALRNQAVLRLRPNAPPFFTSTGDSPGGALFRMRLVDPTGVVLGERLFGMLPGDFDGNGVVDSQDWTFGPSAYDGFLATQDNAAGIRADADASGVVNVASRDGDLSANAPPAGNLGVALPEPPPEF
jgi:hypothetical protein